jgi:putative endonuclease
MPKEFYVYIMASKSRVLYVGMTNDLKRRVYQHQHKLLEGFTKKYNVTALVYYESTREVRAAITREKQIKSWRRSKKIELIESLNPTWKDLNDEIGLVDSTSEQIGMARDSSPLRGSE